MKKYNGVPKKPWDTEDKQTHRRRRATELKGLTYRSGQPHSMRWFHKGGTYDNGNNKFKRRWRLGNDPLARRAV